MSRPLIAVPTYPRLAPGRVQGWADDGVGLPARYVDALRRAGAQEALFLPELDAEAGVDLLGRVDGLLLAGGGDLDPATYDDVASETLYGVSAARDECELDLVRAAIARGLPTLAVCRGHQVLAVALGAKLDQHISGRSGLLDHGTPGVAAGARAHQVRVEPDSKLAHAIGTTTPTVSCHHHQAVTTVGPTTRVVATAADGIIEAVEVTDGDAWIIGVQWHPEDTAGSDPAQQALFRSFVQHCSS